MSAFPIIDLLVYFFSQAFTVVAPPNPKNLKLEHLSVQDGLSDNSVLGIIQDREGFMWFGTRETE